MSKVLAKVKDYAITEEMLNETVEALRTQQNINITSEEQKQDLLDELIARQLVVEDAIESGLTQTEEFQKLYREFVFQPSGRALYKIPAMIVLIHTDLPEPVEPATSI